MSKSLNKQAGFALLMSLIVIGVLITIGLTVLELTISQVRLSTNARASEVAFNAANAGLECARLMRRNFSDEMETGAAITPSCFGGTLSSNTNSEVTSGVTGDGEVFRYDYAFTWGEASDRCTAVRTLVASSTSGLSGTVTTAAVVRGIIAGYPLTAGDWNCAAGERCTLMSVQGYNEPCATRDSFGTVQREVLLQF
jgi:Tfp pilus assembly protein PilX